MQKKFIVILLTLVLTLSTLTFLTGANSTLSIGSVTEASTITADLLSVMSNVGLSDKIPVNIWTQEIDPEIVEAIALEKTGLNRELIREMVANGKEGELSSEAIDNYINAEREIYSRLQKQAHQAFMDDYAFLKTAYTAESTFVSSYAPLIIVELTKNQIQTLSQNSHVEMLSHSPKPQTTIEMDVSFPTIRANEVREVFELTGKGVKIGMIEISVPLVGLASIPKNVVINPDQPGDSNPFSIETAHATAVAEIMVSLGSVENPTWQGIANEAELYCTGIDNFHAGMEWLLDQGVNVINMSAAIIAGTDGTHSGTYGDYDRWIDHIAINHSVHFVQGAGNFKHETNPDNVIVTPGLAYNAITVGNMSDANTTDYEDDMLWFTSSRYEYGIAPNKPDLVAPGTGIRTPIYPDGLLAGEAVMIGTSFSAPHVTGVIAQLLERTPALKVLQDSVKAILTASVRHSVLQYTTSDAEFLEAGAGAIDARSALYTVRLGNYTNSFFDKSNTQEKTFTFTVTNSDTTKRVSLSWLHYEYFSGSDHTTDTVPDYSNDFVQLEMIVRAPDGTIVVVPENVAGTENTNLRIIQFDPSLYGYGTYTVTIKPLSTPDYKVYFGLAWW